VYGEPAAYYCYWPQAGQHWQKLVGPYGYGPTPLTAARALHASLEEQEQAVEDKDEEEAVVIAHARDFADILIRAAQQRDPAALRIMAASQEVFGKPCKPQEQPVPVEQMSEADLLHVVIERGYEPDWDFDVDEKGALNGDLRLLLYRGSWKKYEFCGNSHRACLEQAVCVVREEADPDEEPAPRPLPSTIEECYEVLRQGPKEPWDSPRAIHCMGLAHPTNQWRVEHGQIEYPWADTELAAWQAAVRKLWEAASDA